YIIDQPEQMPAIGLKSFEYAMHLLGWLTIGAVRHQFGIAKDRIEGRPELMTHIGQKLRLVLARLFQLPTLVLDFVEQPHVFDGDDRLIGEGAGQLNLLGSEGLYGATHQQNYPQWHSFPKEWDTEHSAIGTSFLCFEISVLRIC